MTEIGFPVEFPISGTGIVRWLMQHVSRAAADPKSLCAGEYPEHLAKIVCQSPTRLELSVSVGFGGFLVPFLERLYAEAQMNPSRTPKLSRLALRHLDDSFAKSLTALHLLPDDYLERINQSKSRLKTLSQRNGFALEVKTWPRMPPFHGFLCGESALVAPWTVDAVGQLSVDVPMLLLSRKHHGERIDEFSRVFHSASESA